MSAPTITEIVLPGLVEPEGLVVRERPADAPTGHEALIEMEASGVSFAEQQMRRGRYPAQPKFPFVPGYDLVGRVVAVGPDADAALVGQRVAAMVKIGGWSTRVLVDARALAPVPDGVDAGEAETLVLNGLTAWQMLHRSARVESGNTVLVHGANGGVGNTLVQLARHAGIDVIGTASPRHHGAVRAMGAEPIDYADPQLADRVRELAPGGVAAVFDHVGGESFARSFGLVARGGTLVGYGTASQRDAAGSPLVMFASIMARFTAWNVLPNGRRAVFYNAWSGSRVRPATFRARFRKDLGEVFALLAAGELSAQVADRIPLRRAAEALALAESSTIYGKVVLVP